MNIHADIQIIHDRNGAPAFVVLPYKDSHGHGADCRTARFLKRLGRIDDLIAIARTKGVVKVIVADPSYNEALAGLLLEFMRHRSNVPPFFSPLPRVGLRNQTP